jgi:hypothetical protein
MWAAIGNLLRLYSVLTFIGLALSVTSLPTLLGSDFPPELVTPLVIFLLIDIVIAILLWMAKPALVSGSPFFVRWLVGLWVVLSIIGSLGFYLVFIGIAYLLTGEPETESVFAYDREPPKPRYKPPKDWRPNGRVGPSGAMAYADSGREAPMVAMFESSLPVQIVERRDGFTRVIASSGAAGWIDDRTLTEGG